MNTLANIFIPFSDPHGLAILGMLFGFFGVTLLIETLTDRIRGRSRKH